MQQLSTNSASNILMVLLILELDSRHKLTLVSPELTLELKFGLSWIHCISYNLISGNENDSI